MGFYEDMLDQQHLKGSPHKRYDLPDLDDRKETRFTVRLDTNIVEALEEAARQNHVTASKVARAAIVKFLEEYGHDI